MAPQEVEEVVAETDHLRWPSAVTIFAGVNEVVLRPQWQLVVEVVREVTVDVCLQP